MDGGLQEKADQLFEAALESSTARDPRDFYRDRLKQLKKDDPEAYREAVGYYQETLVPGIATDGQDPLEAWLEYGQRLAELVSRGRTVAIDAHGKAEPYEAPVPTDHLVLHLPEDRKVRALLVGLPGELSPAQKATYDLLVLGRQNIRE